MKVINKEIKRKNENYIYFSIYVNKKSGKGHSEVYRIHKDSHNQGLKQGYNTKVFFDFRKLKGKNKSGYYKVKSIYFDNNKYYYNTSDGIYSLPKYLHYKLPNKDYIVVGERVYKKD